MDLLNISISFFTVAVSASLGYVFIQKFFPSRNREIEITKAFKVQDYEKVIEMSKEQKSAGSLNIRSFVAQSLSSKGLHEEAVEWLESSLTKLELSTADKVYIENMIGDEYTNLGDIKKAERHYRTAVSLVPQNELSNYKLALNLYKQEQYEKCRNILKELLKKNPSLVDCRHLYAECLASMQLYPKAMRHYAFLEKIGESSKSGNYALTLKNLKIWDKAYDIYKHILATTKNLNEKEQAVKDLVDVCTSMQRYPESLGLIEEYLPLLSSPKTAFELKYTRANILHMRGDQMSALKEYSDLHKIKSNYKDLQNIMTSGGHWLDYPFLFNYFTSSEDLFERLIARLAPAGIAIVRRSPDYYICTKDSAVYVFYRHINGMHQSVLDKIETSAYYFCPDMDKMEIWSLNGVDSGVSGKKYRLHLKEKNDFLVQLNIIVSQMEHIAGAEPLNFVNTMENLPEVVIKQPAENSAKKQPQTVFEEIVNFTPDFSEDSVSENIAEEKFAD